MGKVSLYQVSVRNRVIHKYSRRKGKVKPMRGRQGNWYPETLLVMAHNKLEAEHKVHEEIAPRVVIGIYKYKRPKFTRQIQILKIEEVE